MVTALADLLSRRRVGVLTGAGCSTESGIPDYRGPGTLRRARNPIEYRQFIREPEARRRYWARAVLGFQRMAEAVPNAAHHSLARLERAGVVSGLVTQNVDGLHLVAGSHKVVELHGALRAVRCLSCSATEARGHVQERLLRLNPGWLELVAEAAPDGDAELPPELCRRFVVVDCKACGGALKPDVVFFGESVPRERVERAFDWFDSADALLVVGSSLAVFSGYRFVKRAVERGTPVGMINLGSSRGDAHATVRVEARAGEVLPELERLLV